MPNNRYSDEEIAKAVAESTSVAEAMRKMGNQRMASSHTHMARRINKMGLDTSHFIKPTPVRKGYLKRRSPAEVLAVSKARVSGRVLTRAMIEIGLLYECKGCGLGKMWQEELLVLEVDHIDGNALDNRIENLRFLCPNCHSQCDSTNLPNRNKRRDKNIIPSRRNLCVGCGKVVPARTKRCRPCFVESRKGSTKINWPSHEELLHRISLVGYSALSKELGITYPTLKRRLKGPQA